MPRITLVDSGASLLDKRVSLFSFGSGYASSFFRRSVKGDTLDIREEMNLVNCLTQMEVVPPEEFVEALCVRVHSYIYMPFQILDAHSNLFIIIASREESQCSFVHSRGIC